MKNSLFLNALTAGGAIAAITVEPAVVTTRPPEATVEPTLTAIESAAATVIPSSPVTNVTGVAFNRFYQVWLENTDFSAAKADANMQWLASQGILLTNYFATTHPSEPNYAAVVGGDNFGMDNDDFNLIPSNISTVVDMLEYGGISWAEYQEDLPYAGFTGFNYSNQKTFANDYVRKHNPLILYDSVAGNASRVNQIKNFTSFDDDLKNQKLAQWAFITPNMTDDGHDTNITFAASWTRKWLTPLLNNSYFMDDTLVLVTFDENEDYTIQNRVFAVLLGGAIPESLRGTTDDTFYNHYSTIATVASNWGLPQLGRWDCGANVFPTVANKTGYKNADFNFDNLYFNVSYPGPVSDGLFTSGWWPAPNTEAKCASGKGVLPSIISTWGKSSGSFNYTNVYPYNALANVDNGTPVIGSNDASSSPSTSTTPSSSTGTSTSTTTASTHSASSSSLAMATALPNAMLLGMAGLAAAFVY